MGEGEFGTGLQSSRERRLGAFLNELTPTQSWTQSFQQGAWTDRRARDSARGPRLARPGGELHQPYLNEKEKKQRALPRAPGPARTSRDP